MTVVIDFDHLVAQYGPGVYAYLWRMLGDTFDAEDAFQETYFRAFRASKRLYDGSNLRAWLYKIATNVARTHRKRERTRTDGRVSMDLEMIAARASVHREVEDHLSLQEVAAAVDKLPHKQRAAFMMRKYSGMDYAAIGVALDCSSEAARANVYQALNKLRSRFRETELKSGGAER